MQTTRCRQYHTEIQDYSITSVFNFTFRLIIPGAHERREGALIPPEWHLQENSTYGMPSGYAWLVDYATSAKRILIIPTLVSTNVLLLYS